MVYFGVVCYGMMWCGMVWYSLYGGFFVFTVFFNQSKMNVSYVRKEITNCYNLERKKEINKNSRLYKIY